MKKVLFSLLTITGILAFGQDSCETAVALDEGTYTVDAVNGEVTPESCSGGDPANMGEWYSVTASDAGFTNVTISTNLPDNAGGDTRIQVYSGSCDGLVCEAESDDIDTSNYLSEISFLVPAGETWYVAFDDLWSADGFIFTVSLENVTPNCEIALPFTENFDNAVDFTGCYTTEDMDGNGISWISQQDLDLDGDGNVETFATNGGGDAGAVDYLFSPVISVDGSGELELVAHFNGFAQEEPSNQNLEAVLLDANTSVSNVVGTFFVETSIPNGEFETLESAAIEASGSVSVAPGDYYLAFKATSDGPTGFILLFDYTLSGALGVNDVAMTNATVVSPNPAKAMVNVRLADKFDAAKTTVTLTNVNGKKVGSFSDVNAVNVERFPAGVYIMTITDGVNTETKKLIKK